jgi:hypothetical protein
MKLKLEITVSAADATNFLVTIQGKLTRRHELNEVLGTRLAHELQAHFTARNKEPNKMEAPKTNFWQDVAEATKLEEVTDDQAVVAIAEQRFRIHLSGGVIKPTGGRKWLTIPLIKDARGRRVEDYEKKFGKKLFRPGYARVLMERGDRGDRTMIGGQGVTVRRGDSFQEIGMRERSRVRPVFALKKQVTIKRDPRALPPMASLAAALQEEANDYIQITSRQS